ncbi:actin-like protein, putative [Hepatocystis sp. ex Piliocolobus tephrosceles]|nr:actin-like protein, putative [Hepatocystis sp. ex Piliocolobus tephrosceles]
MELYSDFLSIVVDLGFENTKIGYSGDECPTNIFSSYVGIPLNLKNRIKNECYKKCLCTKEEFYQFNLIYPLSYLDELSSDVKLKPCLYLNNKNRFSVNEDVLEKILFMNITGDRYIFNLFKNRINDFISNKLHKQTDTKDNIFFENDISDNMLPSINNYEKDYTYEQDKNTNTIVNDNNLTTECYTRENNESTSNILIENTKNYDLLKDTTTSQITTSLHNNSTSKITEHSIFTDTNLCVLKEWANENNYFDFNLIENKAIDIEGIKQMINTYSNNVSCGLNEHLNKFPYLFSLPNKRNSQIKTKISELLFEKYKVPALYFNPKSIFTGFAYNKSVCTVIDVGSCYTDFAICNNGNINKNNYKIFNIGGNTIDIFLEELLQKHNNQICVPYYYDRKSYKNRTSHLDHTHNTVHSTTSNTSNNIADNTTINMADDTTRNMANDTTRNMTDDTTYKTNNDYYNKAKYMPLKDLKNYLCTIADTEMRIDNAKNMIFDENINIYVLPDGQNINITKFQHIGGEIFFTPSLLNNTNAFMHLKNTFISNELFEGLPITLFNMLKNVKSTSTKEELLNNIILTGSTTLLQNFDQRFINEFNKLNLINNNNYMYNDNNNIIHDSNIHNNKNNTNLYTHILNNKKYDRSYASWKGGSILSCFKNFDSFFVTRKEYEDFGFDIVDRKC